MLKTPQILIKIMYQKNLIVYHYTSNEIEFSIRAIYSQKNILF